MIVRAHLPLLLALGCGVGGCTLFVETEDLRSGSAASTGAGGAATTGTGGTSTTSTTSSAGSSGAGGAGGGPVSTGTTGGGGPGGAGPGGGGGVGGDGGAGPTWCLLNAPPDAFLCADFDTPTTGLTSPPWSNETFEEDNGATTLDTSDPSSPPASARVELVDATIPDCGFVALQKDLPGSPSRLLIRFDLRGDLVNEESLVATLDWENEDGTRCKLILGLRAASGFVYEQHFNDSAAEDEFGLSSSPLDGWHTVATLVDTEAGTFAVAIDGTPVEFEAAGGEDMILTPQCTGTPKPESAYVRLGPHCEEPPFVVSFDDVLIAPN